MKYYLMFSHYNDNAKVRFYFLSPWKKWTETIEKFLLLTLISLYVKQKLLTYQIIVPQIKQAR